MKILFFVLTGLVSNLSFASDLKYLKINCYAGGTNSEISFKGLIVGNLDIGPDGYSVAGSEIKILKTKTDNPSCRDWYTVAVTDSGKIIDYHDRPRNWNTLTVKKMGGTTHLSCARGSIVTEFSTSHEFITSLTGHSIDKPNAKLLDAENISSADCILSQLN